MMPPEKSKDLMPISPTVRDGLNPTALIMLCSTADSLSWDGGGGGNRAPVHTRGRAHCSGAPFESLLQDLQEQRAGSPSHREKIAEHPLPGHSLSIHPAVQHLNEMVWGQQQLDPKQLWAEWCVWPCPGSRGKKCMIFP